MNALNVIQVVLILLQGVVAALGKAGLTSAVEGVQAAITSLQDVHGTLVTQAQVQSLKITPQW